MPSSGSCGQSTRGVIFNFGYLGTNKKRSTDPDISCYKYPIPDDTPLPFGHRKIMPDQGDGLDRIPATNITLAGKVTVPADVTQERIQTDALADPKVIGFLEGKKVQRVVYVPRRLVNIVVEG